jgi:hypothetical protein
MFVISSYKTLEITRADRLEARGWLYYKLGEARGNANRINRALYLINAAHRHGVAVAAAETLAYSEKKP